MKQLLKKCQYGAVVALAIAMLLVMTGESGKAQQGDEQRKFLELRRRQIELQAARKQYERSEKLAAQGLVPQTDIDRDRNNVATAQLNYQQAVLAVFELQPRISVRSATKTQTQDGRKFIRLVIANLTPAFDDSQFKLLNNFEGADPIPEQLRTRKINGVFVSLRDSGTSLGGEPNAPRVPNATIALPYETYIPQMEYGETKTLSYQLLRDVDTVIVALSYRNQTQEIPVQVERAAGDSVVQIASSQFSQEADLNGQVTYNLSLERPTVDVRSFHLKVVNLPRQIGYSFIDLESQARLSQINFPAGVSRQSLGLRLFLPERADELVKVDAPLQLWALALDESAVIPFGQDRPYTDGELSGANIGKVKLVIIPRGVGKIDVTANSLFSEVEAGHNVIASITVRNSGTRLLDNIRLSAEHPLNWRVELTPDILTTLEISREQEVRLSIQPPADVGVGDYEVRIKTGSFADNRRVQSEDKIYRVSVKAKTNLLGVGGLVGGLLVLMVGIVVVGVKITRR
jgi:hypothetical protein